ncbi:MAG: hypothetical protein J6R85_00490, partial [Lentisphaeria bacterium]|nr:hypothetical protein [Lentisphaeria bacterium]
FRGEKEDDVASYATALTAELRKIAGDCRISGPVVAPVERIKGKYRYLTQVYGNALGMIRRRLREMILHEPIPKGVEVAADVDALSLM